MEYRKLFALAVFGLTLLSGCSSSPLCSEVRNGVRKTEYKDTVCYTPDDDFRSYCGPKINGAGLKETVYKTVYYDPAYRTKETLTETKYVVVDDSAVPARDALEGLKPSFTPTIIVGESEPLATTLKDEYANVKATFEGTRK
jgi:hypothetical protein